MSSAVSIFYDFRIDKYTGLFLQFIMHSNVISLANRGKHEKERHLCLKTIPVRIMTASSIISKFQPSII